MSADQTVTDPEPITFTCLGCGYTSTPGEPEETHTREHAARTAASIARYGDKPLTLDTPSVVINHYLIQMLNEWREAKR